MYDFQKCNNYIIVIVIRFVYHEKVRKKIAGCLFIGNLL